MDKRAQMPKEALRRIEVFRQQQRKTLSIEDEKLRKRQYRELQEILSPFWAWRGKSI